MPVQCTCLTCGVAFTTWPYLVRRGGGRYCSRPCRDEAARTRSRLLTTFWDWVDRSDPDGCWPWTRSTIGGYGNVRLSPTASMRAHRIAWTLTYGEIPDGMEVCHRCDNPPCCNPAHLFLGTHAENMADMVKKNRRGRDPSLKVTTACPTCGKSFTYYRSWPRKFCSNVCKGKGLVANFKAHA